MTMRGGAVPATLGYRGYTHSCCISINHVICHGIPSEKKLKDGDIVNNDSTTEWNNARAAMERFAQEVRQAHSGDGSWPIQSVGTNTIRSSPR